MNRCPAIETKVSARKVLGEHGVRYLLKQLATPSVGKKLDFQPDLRHGDRGDEEALFLGIIYQNAIAR